MAKGKEPTSAAGDSIALTAPSAYHAMGYADADGMERKATVVRALEGRIEGFGLTRVEAAGRLGIERDELDRVLRGVFRRYEESSLASLLAKLG